MGKPHAGSELPELPLNSNQGTDETCECAHLCPLWKISYFILVFETTYSYVTPHPSQKQKSLLGWITWFLPDMQRCLHTRSEARRGECSGPVKKVISLESNFFHIRFNIVPSPIRTKKTWVFLESFFFFGWSFSDAVSTTVLANSTTRETGLKLILNR